jgi:hypothetical protein
MESLYDSIEVMNYICSFLPIGSALYTLWHNYYMLSMMLTIQIVLGSDYLNRNTSYSGYIYGIYLILVIPYYIVISTYTIYGIMYQSSIYVCLALYISSNFLKIGNNYQRYYLSNLLYRWMHYVGNIATLIMFTGLPKIRVEYYLVETGERIL